MKTFSRGSEFQLSSLQQKGHRFCFNFVELKFVLDCHCVDLEMVIAIASKN